MSKLSRFQDQFLAALYEQSPDRQTTEWSALLAQPGFAVYKNNLFKACIEALRANFPTVEQLLGEEFFTATAQQYVSEFPPRQVQLIHYGEHFPDFLASFTPLQAWPYIADVARVDSLWLAVFCAKECPALNAEALQGLSPQALGELPLQVRPSVRWVWSGQHPLYCLWHHNRQQLAMPEQFDWQGEGVLITRQRGQLHGHPLTRAMALFLDACSSGYSLQQASDLVLAAQPQTDFTQLFSYLLAKQVFQLSPSASL